MLRKACILLMLAASAGAAIPEQSGLEIKHCDGTTTGFAASFVIQAATDVKVLLVNTATTPYTVTALTSPANFSVSVANGRYPATGFTVTTVTKYAATYDLVITTDIALTETGVLSTGRWEPAIVTRMINKSRLIDNEFDRRLQQSIHNPDYFGVTPNTTLPEKGAAGYVYRDGDGEISLTTAPSADAATASSYWQTILTKATLNTSLTAMGLSATVITWLSGDIGQFFMDRIGDASNAEFAAGLQSDSVNVMHYGAVGDGSEDDTAAIQAAINAMTTGTLVIPPGTYAVSDTLNVGIFSVRANDDVLGFAATKTNFRITGGGTLKWVGSDQPGTTKVTKTDSVGTYDLITDCKPVISVVACQGFSMENLTIDCNDGDGHCAYAGVWFQGNHNVHTLRNVTITGGRIGVRHGCAWDWAASAAYWGYGNSPYLKANVYDMTAVGGWQGDTQNYAGCQLDGLIAGYTSESAQNLAISMNSVIINESEDASLYGIAMVGGRLTGNGVGICHASSYDIWEVTGNNVLRMTEFHSETAATYKIRTPSAATAPDIELVNSDTGVLYIAGGGGRIMLANVQNVNISRLDVNARLDVTCIGSEIDGFSLINTGSQDNINVALLNCTYGSTTFAGVKTAVGTKGRLTILDGVNAHLDTTLTLAASAAVKNGSTSGGYVDFHEDSDNGTNRVRLIGPASTADVVLTLPSSDGEAGQLLQTNGSGVMSWVTASGTGDFLADGSVPMTAPLFINEVSAASADQAGKGQIWVKDTTPNELWFTNDAGTDFQLGTSGAGDVTAVWGDDAGDVSGLTAGEGDTLDATNADSTVPWRVNATAAPTVEGQVIWEGDADALRVGDGAATLTFAMTRDKLSVFAPTTVAELMGVLSDEDAGTNLAADLEEEAHASEHAVGASDAVFPADPGFDAFLIWDDDPGTLAFVAVTSYLATAGTDNVKDTHIDWGSGAGQVDLADIPGGTAGANAFDFGGATSVEIPNGTNPTVDAAGEIAQDTDGANETGDVSIRAYDGTNTFMVERKLKVIQATIIKPQDMADATRDLCPIWSNNTGMTFTITEIRAWSDTDDTTVAVELVTATDFSNPTLVDALEIATDGTGVYTATETTITDATVAHDEILTLDFDDTDNPGWVKVEITGWYNAAVD